MGKKYNFPQVTNLREVDLDKTKSSPLKTVLRVVLSLGLLVLLFHKFGFKEISATLAGANKLYLLGGLSLYLLGVVVCSYRWGGLLSAHGVHVPLSRLTALYFVGIFFSNVLPGSITGDVVKAYQLSRYSQRTDVAVSTVVMDRVVGILMLLAVAAGATPFGYHLVPPTIPLIIVVVAVAAWGGVWLLKQRGLWRWLRQRIGPINRIAKSRLVQKIALSLDVYDRKVVVRALAISLLFDMLWISVRYLIAEALGVHLNIWYFLLFIPLITLATMIPIFFSGLGVREVSYVYLFSQVGVPAPLCISMSLVFYAFRLCGGVIGGVLYTLGVPGRPPREGN